jgi:hypothetical protein
LRIRRRGAKKERERHERRDTELALATATEPRKLASHGR